MGRGRKHKPSEKEVRLRARAFLDCRRVAQLAARWYIEPDELVALSQLPVYNVFRLPKKRPGTFRRIEDPDPPLKRILRRLNADLQADYHTRRSPAAYGFLINPADTDDKRDILTNAHRHLGARWLLNVDMRDFFHQIERDEVEAIFRAVPYRWPEPTVKMLGGLTTYRGRLPMGAPTSPVLSNLYALPLDASLSTLAKQRGWTYTRYADDMTFSSHDNPITLADIEPVAATVERHELFLNPAKSIVYGPDDLNKEVTGLVVGGEAVQLSPEYLQKAFAAIDRLSDIVDARYLATGGRVPHKHDWVRTIEQRVEGLLNFAERVLPAQDERLRELHLRYSLALEPPVDYGPVSWLDYGYLNLPLDADPDELT